MDIDNAVGMSEDNITRAYCFYVGNSYLYEINLFL